MMFKSRLVAFVGALVLASSSYAMPEKPAACPGMPALQSEGVTMSAELLEGIFVTYHLSHYNTPSNWVFIMGPIVADSDEAALEESNKILSVLSGTATPEEDGQDGWVCLYDSGRQDFSVFAIQADDMVSPAKISRLLRKGH